MYVCMCPPSGFADRLHYPRMLRCIPFPLCTSDSAVRLSATLAQLCVCVCACLGLSLGEATTSCRRSPMRRRGRAPRAPRARGGPHGTLEFRDGQCCATGCPTAAPPPMRRLTISGPDPPPATRARGKVRWRKPTGSWTQRTEHPGAAPLGQDGRLPLAILSGKGVAGHGRRGGQGGELPRRAP